MAIEGHKYGKVLTFAVNIPNSCLKLAYFCPDTTLRSNTMLNMDFSKPVTLDTNTLDWVASPKAGVWRKPLARQEAEHGHATSIVRYDPGASFSSHNHPLGEEILVLEGTFSDATGDFQAGTYFRNPMGFVHSPYSKQGCVILVKLYQFQSDDSKRLSIETDKGHWENVREGVRMQSLHEHKDEKVLLLSISASAVPREHSHPGGEEVLVMKGVISDEDGIYPAGTWLRRPPGSKHTPKAESDALLWIKSGHLK